jgi:hypothetical protein
MVMRNSDCGIENPFRVQRSASRGKQKAEQQNIRTTEGRGKKKAEPENVRTTEKRETQSRMVRSADDPKFLTFRNWKEEFKQPGKEILSPVLY